MPKSFLIKKTDKTWRRYSPKELPAGQTFSTVGPTLSSGGPTFSTAGPTFSMAGPTLSPDCSVHVEEEVGRRMRFMERTVVEEVVSCRKTIWSPPTEIEPCIGSAWSGGPIVRDTSTVLRQFTDLIQPMAFRLKENGFLFDSAHPHNSRVPPSPFIFSERFSLQLPPYRRYHGSPPREMDLLTPPSPSLDHLSRLHDSRSLDLSLDHCKNIPSPLSPACSASAMLDFSPTGAHSEAGSGNSISGSQHSSSRRCSSFQDGVTVGYTYDAFFVSDGRSRRRNPLTIMPDQSRTRYKCSECGKHYATSSNLSRHKQTHRSLDSQQAKQCPHCHKIYVSMPALSMHILTHDLKYQCNVCDKAFSRPWLLQGHLRSHTGEKPFGCAHCGKAFADRSNLRAHMQTHSAFKLYTCKRCNKSFALKAYLNKHLESACFKDDDDDECSNSSMTSIWSV